MCKWPTTISEHLSNGLTFWVVAYKRLNCIYLHPRWIRSCMQRVRKNGAIYQQANIGLTCLQSTWKYMYVQLQVQVNLLDVLFLGLNNLGPRGVFLGGWQSQFLWVAKQHIMPSIHCSSCERKIEPLAPRIGVPFHADTLRACHAFLPYKHLLNGLNSTLPWSSLTLSLRNFHVSSNLNSLEWCETNSKLGKSWEKGFHL